MLLMLVASIAKVLVLLVFARAVASFFVRDWSSGIPRFLWDVTEPILAPVRRVLPPMGGMDFSPMIVVFVLGALAQYLGRPA